MSSQSCLDEKQLQALLDGLLPPDDVTALSLHLDHCQTCRQRLEKIAGSLSVPDRSEHESTRIEDDSILDNLIHSLKSELPQVPKTATTDHPAAQNEQWRAALDPPKIPDSLGRIGDYDVTEVLGAGGMGVVLRGRDSILDRDVAIKFPHHRLTRTEKSRQRFLNEARSAAALEHENVVRVYQVGVQHDEPFLVMELVEGETLQDLLNRKESVPNEELRQIAIHAARGLEAAHREGLLHGDVKPANLLINRQTGQLKLSDFGLTRAIDISPIGTRRVVAGTPEYMSPEQAGAQTVDARSDLYSLGVVLYALATGTAPVSGRDLDDLLLRIGSAAIEPVRQRNPKLDRDLARMIDRLLQKQPADRPGSAGEVAATLSLDRRRLRRRIATAMLATIALVACFFFAELAGWIDVVAGIGPQEIVEPLRPFQIVGRELSFDTLEESIEQAKDGDIIDIFAPGPHAVRPIEIRDKQLTIRGVGGRPAIVPFRDSSKGEPLIVTNTELRLESLEIHFQAPSGRDDVQRWQYCAVQSHQASLWISKCRFRISRGNAAIAVDSGSCRLDDCEVYGGQGIGVVWRPFEQSKLTIQNSVMSTRVGIYVDAEHSSEIDTANIEMTGSTFRSEILLFMGVGLGFGQPGPNWQITANDNDFDSDHFFSLGSSRRVPIEKRIQRGRRIFLRNLFVFAGEKNRIRNGASLAAVVNNPPVALFDQKDSSTAWIRFLGGKKAAMEFGKINFVGPIDSLQREDHQVESFEPLEVDSND